MKAYVLAAGYATRLYPLTRDRAKPLLDVGGAPVLSRILDRVTRLEELSEIVLVTNARFHEQFLAWKASYPAPVPIRIVNDGSTGEDDRLGALGDLALALAESPPGGADWLVVAGDNLLDFDLRPLRDRFRQVRAPLLVLRNVDHGGGPTPYNEVTVADDGRVLRFREKPDDPATGLSAIGLYFFTPEVAGLLDRYLAEGGVRDAPGHFIAWLVGKTSVVGATFEGRWHDIGSPDTLRRARELYPGPGSGKE